MPVLAHTEVVLRLYRISPTIEVLGRYQGAFAPLKCGCLVCGHKWWPKWSHLSQGGGCPKCARERGNDHLRTSVQEVIRRLDKVGVKLVGHYKNKVNPTMFRCKQCRHQWTATPQNLLKKRNPTGCPRCCQKRAISKRSLTIQEVTIKLKNAKIKVRVLKLKKEAKKNLRCFLQCLQCDHKWWTPLCSLVHNRKNGKLRAHGCPKCSHRLFPQNKLSLDEIKNRLKERTDINVQQYTSFHKKVDLRCRRCQHKWSAFITQLILPKSARGLRSPQKCPRCFPHQFGASEEEVRSSLELLTGLKWPRANPSEVPWLRGLYLDGYCQDLKSNKWPNGIAFEYQGPQHYGLCQINGSHDTHKKLEKRKRNDLRKRIQCWRHKVKLILVPYWMKTEKLGTYLSKKLAEFTN